MNPDLNFTLYTKINLKYTMDLNVKQYDIQKKNKEIFENWEQQMFLDLTPKA